MTTIEYLDQVRRIDVLSKNRMADLKNNLSRIRDAAVGLTGLRYDGDRVQTSGLSDPTSKPAVLLASMEQDTNRTVNEMLTLRNEIVAQIESLQNVNHYDILFRHFVLHKSIGCIANEWKYSWKQTNQVYREALEVFEAAFGQGYLHCPRKTW